MEAYKQEFIEFMVESEVLKFGEFTLKSGRKSPFFMNAGAYVTGAQLKNLPVMLDNHQFVRVLYPTFIPCWQVRCWTCIGHADRKSVV